MNAYVTVRSWPWAQSTVVQEPVAWDKFLYSLGLCLPIYKIGRGLKRGRGRFTYSTGVGGDAFKREKGWRGSMVEQCSRIH